MARSSPQLPHNVLVDILDRIDDQPTLASACLASRAISSLAKHMLWYWPGLTPTSLIKFADAVRAQPRLGRRTFALFLISPDGLVVTATRELRRAVATLLDKWRDLAPPLPNCKVLSVHGKLDLDIVVELAAHAPRLRTLNAHGITYIGGTVSLPPKLVELDLGQVECESDELESFFARVGSPPRLRSICIRFLDDLDHRPEALVHCGDFGQKITSLRCTVYALHRGCPNEPASLVDVASTFPSLTDLDIDLSSRHFFYPLKRFPSLVRLTIRLEDRSTISRLSADMALADISDQLRCGRILPRLRRLWLTIPTGWTESFSHDFVRLDRIEAICGQLRIDFAWRPGQAQRPAWWDPPEDLEPYRRFERRRSPLQETSLSSCPIEVLDIICSYLPCRCCLNLARCCRRLREPALRSRYRSPRLGSVGEWVAFAKAAAATGRLDQVQELTIAMAFDREVPFVLRRDAFSNPDDYPTFPRCRSFTVCYPDGASPDDDYDDLEAINICDIVTFASAVCPNAVSLCGEHLLLFNTKVEAYDLRLTTLDLTNGPEIPYMKWLLKLVGSALARLVLRNYVLVDEAELLRIGTHCPRLEHFRLDYFELFLPSGSDDGLDSRGGADPMPMLESFEIMTGSQAPFMLLRAHLPSLASLRLFWTEDVSTAVLADSLAELADSVLDDPRRCPKLEILELRTATKLGDASVSVDRLLTSATERPNLVFTHASTDVLSFDRSLDFVPAEEDVYSEDESCWSDDDDVEQPAGSGPTAVALADPAQQAEAGSAANVDEAGGAANEPNGS